MYSSYYTYCVYDVSIRKAAHKYIITNELYNLPTDILLYYGSIIGLSTPKMTGLSILKCFERNSVI